MSQVQEKEKKYKEILEGNGIKEKIKKIEILVPDFAGDNFASKSETATIYFENPIKTPLHLFAKNAIENNTVLQILKDIQLYEKEAGFFNSILPKLKNYCQQQLGHDNFLENLLPKCYHADEELVVLENLVERGYKMLDKKAGHDLNQAKLVMNNFAKLHAVSYCIIEEMGVNKFLEEFPFTKRSSLWSAQGEQVHGPWVNGSVRAALKTLENFPVDCSKELVEFLLDYQKKGYLDLCKYFDVTNDSCGNVLNHGDGWNCNILFKNSETVADSCIFIDLQTIHVGSPVLDLLYYLNLSVKTGVRREFWGDLIKIYYTNFKNYVEELKGTVKFTFEDLIEDCRKKCKPLGVLGLYVVFGWDILDGFGDPEGVEEGVDVAELLNSTMCQLICDGIAGREFEFSTKLVEAYLEYKKLAFNL